MRTVPKFLSVELGERDTLYRETADSQLPIASGLELSRKTSRGMKGAVALLALGPLGWGLTRTVLAVLAGQMIPMDGLIAFGFGLVFASLLPDILHSLTVRLDTDRQKVEIDMSDWAGRLDAIAPLDEAQFILRKWTRPFRTKHTTIEASLYLRLPEHLISMYAGDVDNLERLAENLKTETGVPWTFEEGGDDGVFIGELKESVGAEPKDHPSESGGTRLMLLLPLWLFWSLAVFFWYQMATLKGEPRDYLGAVVFLGVLIAVMVPIVRKQ